MIDQNETTVGTFLFSRSQAALEVLAEVGFDFVVIGAEHFMKNPETIEGLITTAEAANIVPFVRIEENVDLISRVLDCGAEGIIAPMIDNPEEAREVVKAAKYPPIGERGVGNPRSTGYGVDGADHLDECYEQQNQNQSVVLQIETVKALVNLKDIASIDGVDSLFVGPWDLSHSIGENYKESQTELLEEKIDECLKKSSESNIPLGIFAWGSEETNRRISQGFDYVITGGDMIFLANNAKESLKKIKG